MSHFLYGSDVNNPKKHHKKRYDVYIRKSSNSDILDAIKKTKLKRINESVDRVIVKEYDGVNDMIWIEVWCVNLWDTIKKKDRYNVFFIKLPINEEWVCEGDLGKGLK